MNSKSSRTQAQVFKDIADERDRQNAKFGELHHPNGTGLNPETDKYAADRYRDRCNLAAKEGKLTWRHISDEEMAEAYAESDDGVLRKELVQQAAVLVAWIEDIDSRKEKL